MLTEPLCALSFAKLQIASHLFPNPSTVQHWTIIDIDPFLWYSSIPPVTAAMSTLIGKFLTILGLKRREANILVVGLDNSGKSTILNYLKRKEDQVEEVVPTVGFTVERLSGLAKNKSGLTLTAFDMSGQGK